MFHSNMHNAGEAKNLINKKQEYQNRINEVARIMTKTWVTLEASSTGEDT